MGGIFKYLLQPFKSTKSTLAYGSLVGLFLITAYGCSTRDRELLIMLIPVYTMVFVHYFKKDGNEIINRPEDYIKKDEFKDKPYKEIKT